MKAKQALLTKAISNLLETITEGSFAVKYKNGATERYGSRDPEFTVHINDDITPIDLIGADTLTSFGEAYMDGRIDVEGDLADLMSLALRNGLVSATATTNDLAGTVRGAVARMRSLRREKENIAHHYDLGNDFFGLWLDESLTYSCAYFHHESDSLEDAQRQKIDHSLRKLRLQPAETLLDIGCGWGSLVMRAVEHFGAIATGVTLSEEQSSAANAAIVSRCMQDNASVRLADYSELAEEGGRFDKIVSIGMIEHVGKENLDGFVKTVKGLLKPGGLALLHLITGVQEGPINRWVERYIFPGGYLPTLPEIIGHLSRQDLRVWDVENLAPHYRLTLDHWSERFERTRLAVSEMFDERFVRMWRLYLRVSSAAFREGVVEVHQILASNGRPDGLPLTREDIYKEERQC